jgi:hypothetical protein
MVMALTAMTIDDKYVARSGTIQEGGSIQI